MRGALSGCVHEQVAKRIANVRFTERVEMEEKKSEHSIKKTAASSKEHLGLRILNYCRSELYAQYPQMDLAFAALSAEPSRQTEMAGTDGSSLFFSPQFLIEAYAESPQKVLRGYFHLLLHCLYFHLQRPQQYETRLWNLACDITVEQIVEREMKKWGNSCHFNSRSGERQESGEKTKSPIEEKSSQGTKANQQRNEKSSLSKEKDHQGIQKAPNLRWSQAEKREEIRRDVWQQLTGCAASAESVYESLQNGVFPYSLGQMEAAFCFDDHSLWEVPKEQQAEIRRKWEKIRKESGNGGSRAGGTSAGSGSGSFQETLEITKKSRGDYRKFLRQFAVLREELKLDQTGFDYIYYSYGMEHYGNIPLIEPLEYSEVNRLEELVIAIDTSGSCTSKMVEQFLAETYGILSEKENFFEKMNVYLIQCDCCIQNVRHITSRCDWEKCGKYVEIQGRGGTDFRPVFGYIEKLKQKKALKNLRALIYFTDGDGIYPEQRPEYETAFVSLGKSKRQIYTPDWVQRMYI